MVELNLWIDFSEEFRFPFSRQMPKNCRWRRRKLPTNMFESGGWVYYYEASS
jgi:hypothetical protein